MHLEYLIFNIIVISGPLFFGSFQHFYFVDRWRDTLISAGIVAVPYIIWDVLVTDRHWMFNSEYTLNFRLAHFNDYILILRPFSSKKMFLSGHFSCGFRF